LRNPTDATRRGIINQGAFFSPYTPQEITSFLVKEALEPLVEPIIEGCGERNKRGRPIRSPGEILELKVCDPAMGGSGRRAHWRFFADMSRQVDAHGGNPACGQIFPKVATAAVAAFAKMARLKSEYTPLRRAILCFARVCAILAEQQQRSLLPHYPRPGVIWRTV
jgi:hypothetical protein